MSQYFAEQPDSAHDVQNWSFELRGQQLNFSTDSGVFSKQTVDYGTRTLLKAFDWQQLPAGPLLDLGAGYGPIGLTLAKLLPKRQIILAEINQRAAALAQENAVNNQINNADVVVSDAYQSLGQQKFAAILTNPPIRAGKAVVSLFLIEAAQHLVSGGSLWVVIQKKQGEPSAKKIMTATFGNAVVVMKDKGYYILKSVLV